MSVLDLFGYDLDGGVSQLPFIMEAPKEQNPGYFLPSLLRDEKRKWVESDHHQTEAPVRTLKCSCLR